MGTIQVAGRELVFDRDAARISGPNGEVRFPSEPGNTIPVFSLPENHPKAKPLGNRVLVALRMGKDGAADPTFEVNDPTQDLVAITPDCQVDWIVEATPSLLETDRRHRVIVPVHDRLLTRTGQGGRFFEVDAETGEVLDYWPSDAFVINGKTHQLGSRATVISTVGGKTIVNTKDGALFEFDAECGEIVGPLNAPDRVVEIVFGDSE